MAKSNKKELANELTPSQNELVSNEEMPIKQKSKGKLCIGSIFYMHPDSITEAEKGLAIPLTKEVADYLKQTYPNLKEEIEKILN